MRLDLTDVTVVLDRSGSMQDMLEDAQGGLDHFIFEQKALHGECTFTLVQFDNYYEVPIRAVSIREVSPHKIVPRGSTAMRDAVGRTIVETGQRLSAMNEQDRPGLVIIAIITDGLDNASVNFTPDALKQMIEHQIETYKWKFVYIGANQDAWVASESIGIGKGSASGYAANSASSAYAGLSANVARMRTQNLAGHTVSSEFTDLERSAMGDTKVS